MVSEILSIIEKYLSNGFGINVDVIRHLVLLSFIIIVACICGFLFKKLLIPILKRIVEKTPFKFDDFLIADNVIRTISHLFPALIAAIFLPICYVGEDSSSVCYIIISRILNIYIIILIAHLICGVLSNIACYRKSDYSDANNHYTDAIIQFIKVIIYFFTAVIVVAVAINRNPTTLLAGLGAMATILLLVFQDTILGFVAGMQLNINKMLEVGDWVEIRGKGINGYVVEVNLTTIKIKNFDNSISTIPPYKLISETFQNWKGLRQYGGRQARKTLNLDMVTIHFANKSQVDALIDEKLIQPMDNETINCRTTNVGLYRKHIEKFLQSHPMIENENWLMVRQLNSSAYGMAIELYFYVKELDFVKYEEIVAEIYEYCIAVAPKFDLKIYQSTNITTQNIQI